MRLFASLADVLFSTFVLISISDGSINEILSNDFLHLLDHWDIKFLSLIQLQETDLLGIEIQARRRILLLDYMNQNIRINNVRGDLIESQNILAGGAILCQISTSLPETVYVELIRLSGTKRPLILYAPNTTLLPAWLHKTRIPYTSNVYVILQDSAQHPAELTLQGVYHLHEESAQLTVDLVARRRLHGLTARWTFFGPKLDLLRRTDLQGLVIRTVYPAVLYLPDTRGMKKLFEHVRSIVDVTTRALNASTEAVVVHEANIVGSRNADGSWTGSLGMLQRREAEISSVMFSQSTESIDAVDASHPYIYAKNYLFLRKPKFVFSLNATLEGFSGLVWLVSCVALLSLAAALSLISFITRRNDIGDGEPADLSNFILEVLGDVCLQGWHRLPTSKSGLVVVVSSILLGYVLNLLYVNQLTAGLTADNAPLPFRTLEEMVTVKTHMPMVFRGSWTYIAAQIATHGPFRSLNEMLIKHGSNAYFTNVRAGLDYLCQEKAVMFVWDINVKPLLSQMNCSIVCTNMGALPMYLSLGVKKHYPYLPQINYFLRRIAEGGIVQRFLSYFEMDEVAQDEFKEIEFSGVVPFLLLYGTALVACVAIFACELLCSKISPYF